MPCKNAMINFFNQTIESLKIMDFLKKTVIITGANRGTGRCIAENFIANGAEVFIHSLKEGDSLNTVKEIGFGEPLWGDISCDSGSDRVLSQFKKKSQRLSKISQRAVPANAEAHLRNSLSKLEGCWF